MQSTNTTWKTFLLLKQTKIQEPENVENGSVKITKLSALSTVLRLDGTVRYCWLAVNDFVITYFVKQQISFNLIIQPLFSNPYYDENFLFNPNFYWLNREWVKMLIWIKKVIGNKLLFKPFFYLTQSFKKFFWFNPNIKKLAFHKNCIKFKS